LGRTWDRFLEVQAVIDDERDDHPRRDPVVDLGPRLRDLVAPLLPVQAVFRQLPLIPWWAIPAAPLLLLVLLLVV
jgi:hypothetical protein